MEYKTLPAECSVSFTAQDREFCEEEAASLSHKSLQTSFLMHYN